MNAFTRTPVRVDVDGMAQIGMTRHSMMGIRYDEGEGGAVPQPPAGGTGGTGAGENSQGGQNGGTGGNAGGAGQSAETPPAINRTTGKPYTPAETREYITSIRDEAKTQREGKETAERDKAAADARLAAVMAALGQNPDGTPLVENDPDKLAKNLAERTSDAENTKRENLVLRVSPTHSANADRLLDSRAFTNKLSELKSDDRAGVEALVKEWIEKDPSYKNAPSGASSSGGGSHSGAGNNNTGRKTMQEAVKAGIAKKR